MIIQTDFYELDQFLAYFNQDWVSLFFWNNEKPNFQAVSRYIKYSYSSDNLKSLIDNIERFLSLPLNENEFNKSVVEIFGCGYTPRSQGLTKRQFLEESLKILKEPMEETKKHFIPEFIG